MQGTFSHQQLLDGELLHPSLPRGVKHHWEAVVGSVGVAEPDFILGREEIPHGAPAWQDFPSF